MSDSRRAPVSPVLGAARAYAAGGLAVVPVPPDGSKRPRLPWRRYQRRPPADAQLAAWFGCGRNGPAALCGRVSGGLEVVDFDDAGLFDPWCALVGAHAAGLPARLPVVRSPGPGYHVYLRCPEQTAGNQKLAQAPGPNGRPVALIETRGEGGLVLTPACPPACHPGRRPYLLLWGDLADVPVVSPEERGVLLDAARSFNRYVPPRRVVAGLPGASRPIRPLRGAGTQVGETGRRPGDRYNGTAAWPAVLERHGWECVRVDAQGVGHWRRPGKADPGWSATTDYAGAGLLYVFSSNAAPFEPGRAYTKFAARALLDFGGDFRAAARALATDGAGSGPVAPAGRPAPAWPGEVVRGSDGSLVRRLPPLQRPTGVPLPELTRPAGATPVLLAPRAPGTPGPSSPSGAAGGSA